ncbi:MAG: hypothetical protein ACYT04_27500 [Nostoc sp.]
MAVIIGGSTVYPGEIKTCNQLMPNAAGGKLTYHISVKIIDSIVINTTLEVSKSWRKFISM